MNGMAPYPLSRLPLLLPAILLLLCPAGHAQPGTTDAFEQNRKLGRGVNISATIRSGARATRRRFQAKHFRLLKEAGFNSVRINLQPFRQMDAANDYALSESWFEVLDWAVREAQAQELARDSRPA